MHRIIRTFFFWFQIISSFEKKNDCFLSQPVHAYMKKIKHICVCMHIWRKIQKKEAADLKHICMHIENREKLV